jgi:hypothetical protein
LIEGGDLIVERTISRKYSCPPHTCSFRRNHSLSFRSPTFFSNVILFGLVVGKGVKLIVDRWRGRREQRGNHAVFIPSLATRSTPPVTTFGR